MVTDRDQVALNFIELFRIVTPKQVSRYLYKDINVTNNRLNRMLKDGVIYRKKNGYDGGYCYSLRPIQSLKQYRHYWHRTEFYLLLLERGYTIQDCYVELKRGSVKPDMLLRMNGRWVAVEVELTTARIDTGKYNRYSLGEYKEYFNVMPSVWYVTDKKVLNANYSYKVIDTKFKNLGSL